MMGETDKTQDMACPECGETMGSVMLGLQDKCGSCGFTRDSHVYVCYWKPYGYTLDQAYEAILHRPMTS
jgi:ribosomal protein L37E